MDLDIIEINLDLVKEEQIFEEIEEKKIELVDNKVNEKYISKYNSYLSKLKSNQDKKNEKSNLIKQKNKEVKNVKQFFKTETEKIEERWITKREKIISDRQSLTESENNIMNKKIKNLTDWYNNQNIISKVILFFQKYNLADEKNKIEKEHRKTISCIDENFRKEIFLAKGEYKEKLNELTLNTEKQEKKLNEEIASLANELKQHKYNIYRFKTNIKYIESNDILIIDDLYNQVNDICNYKKYPMKKLIKDLEFFSEKIISKYSNHIKVIVHDEFHELKKYIDERIMFLPDTKNNFINNELEKTKELLSNIDGKSLDNQQRTAVVTDEDNILVVAGAGSGKTLTISAKVKYLVEELKVNPRDILLITFTKKAAEEMEIRIKEKLGIDIKVKTFHALGYEILSSFEDKKSDIYPGPEVFVKQFKKEVELKDEEFAMLLFKYLSVYIYPYVDPESFSSLGDFYKRNKLTGMEAIKNKINNVFKRNNNAVLNVLLDSLSHTLEVLNNNIRLFEKRKAIDNLEEIAINLLKKIENEKKNEEIRELLNEFINKCEEIREEETGTIQEKINEMVLTLDRKKRSIKREQMKSIEEVVIANFLFVNGIEYEYEPEYKYVTSSKSYRQYKPDFYLPEYNIYIEHFGINENGRCPQYSRIEEMRYLQGLQWKRDIHKENGTIMAETYSFEHKKGLLIDKLKKILEKYNIPLNPMTKEEILENIIALSESDTILDFYKLLNTFLNLFKASNFNEAHIDQFRKEASNEVNDYVKNKHTLFLDIFERYYKEYQQMLKDNNQIDFNDMINKATGYLQNNNLPKEFNFKYIIIDEFQDISVARYKLIKLLKDLATSKVMAVGDDWQSIYKFAGSEISLFTNFESYFGDSEILKIEKTYRNSQELIDIAGRFVMTNKEQFIKNLVSDKRKDQVVQLVAYNNFNMSDDLDTDSNSLTRKIIEILESFGNETKKVALLGRNNYDIEALKKSKFFYLEEEEGKTKISTELFPDLEIEFMSIHKSKGLEADEVIIINNKNSVTGFPNQITNDSVLGYVSIDSESYMFAEERRLFYVALTRTKNRVYLLYPEDYSIFIQELMNYNSPNIANTLLDNTERPISCPTCKTGHLIAKKGAKGLTFYSCSNYPQCDFKITDLKYVKSKVRCPKCGGVMQLKKGPYGDFYGCINYPICTFTYSIEEYEKLK